VGLRYATTPSRGEGLEKGVAFFWLELRFIRKLRNEKIPDRPSGSEASLLYERVCGGGRGAIYDYDI